MPAVTVAAITGLARIPEAVPDAADREIRSVTTGPRGFEGEGFSVRRAFAGVDLTDLGPSTHRDQMGRSATGLASRRARLGTRTAGSRP